MLIGAMSDTHGRLDTTEAALKLLQDRKVEAIIHTGDVGTRQVLDLLAGAPPVSVVWGNTDYERKALERHAASVGVKSYGVLGRITFGATVVSFLHGDDDRQMNRLLEAQDCDLLLHGHTHVRRVTDVGRIRIVNPGALHRANPHTVAVIDSETREVKFLTVTL